MPPITVPVHRALSHDIQARRDERSQDHGCEQELDPSAFLSQAGTLARLRRNTTTRSVGPDSDFPEAHQHFKSFIRERDPEGWHPEHRGVCFENLTTVGIASEDSSPKTLATALWRTLTGRDIYEWTIQRYCSSPSRVPTRAIISDLSGVVRNGEMMLVLGTPGSGCSTFLRTLGNQHSAFLKVKGLLSFSGLTSEDVAKSYRGEVAYVPEEDNHFPTLSVRQTLDFVLRSKVPRRYHSEIPDYLEMYGKVFGMSHVLDTLVGNDYIRGVSGGERKRVSIMETLAVDSAVVAWDNSTRGLDAASAVKYAQSLRIMTDVTGKATIVTLYQASDAILKLMDKIMVLDEGRMIYQGPVSKAQGYFESLGFYKEARQPLADFLTGVTVPSQRRFREGMQAKAPRSAEELEKAFRESQLYGRIADQIKAFKDDPSETSSKDSDPHPFKATAPTKKSKYVPASSSYNTSFPLQVRLCVEREWSQLKQHMYPIYVRLVIVFIMAFLIGSMFYDMPQDTTGIYSRGGFVFYGAIAVGWVQLAELEGAMEGRDIIARHKQQAIVRPSVVGFAKVLFDMLVVLGESIIFSVIAYFLAGMRPEAGPFFIFTLFIFIEAFCLTQIYRFFAAFSPSFELALRYCGVMLLACILFGGYLYPPNNLLSDVPWVGWIAYVVPIVYGFEGILAAEFTGITFQCDSSRLVPRGAQYDTLPVSCAIAGAQPGQRFVDGAQYLSSYYGFTDKHVWRNFGIVLGMSLFYVLLTMCLLEYFDWSSNASGAAGVERVKKERRRKTAVNDTENQRSSNHSSTLDTPDEPSRPATITATNSVFTWKNIAYTILYKGSDRTLIENASGYCKPGEMTALVGASGAGKSTLLTVLTQRQKIGSVSGELMVNGASVGPSYVKDIGFCPQGDIHDDTSTVHEAFVFSALLRQDFKVPEAEKIAYTENVLQTLGLSHLRHAVIGSLSLEAKRRTSIGVELCAKPKLLLFLDEPTSGLDSQGALEIVRLLRKLADGGQAIVCTIHQASHQQIVLFDRVLALNPGGTTFYNGPVGPSGQSIFAYFDQHGCTAEPGKNAADFIIEVGTGGINPVEKDNMDWSATWSQSSEAGQVLDTIEKLRKDQSGSAKKQPEGSNFEFSASVFYQTKILTIRNLRQFFRIAEYTYARLYASFIHAIFNGLTFLQLDDSVFALQAMAYSLFLILMLVPEFINGISMRFIANRNIWLEKELPSRTYGWFAFATSQIIAELPYALIGGVMFYVIFYFMVGLPLGLPAGYVFLMTMAFHLFATNWGQWIAAMSPDAMTAANLMPFFIIMCELFNGILQPVYQMPAFWRYTMYYVAPFTYWIAGTLGVVLRDRPVRCQEDELIYFPLSSGDNCSTYTQQFFENASGYLSNPDARGEETLCGYCQYITGEDFLSTYRISGSQIWRNLAIFFGFVVSNYVLVYVLVYVNSPQCNWFSRISRRRKGQ